MDLSGRTWHVTGEERLASYPCDRLIGGPVDHWTRGIDIAAPTPLVFRWLKQLTIAPYSYDWIDFRGAKSPRELTPGLPDIAVGQRFLVFEVASFESDKHITALLPAPSDKRYGEMAVSYTVRPRAHGCRLVVRVATEAAGPVTRRLRRRLLAWGDLIMMRKQLLRLKELAETAK